MQNSGKRKFFLYSFLLTSCVKRKPQRLWCQFFNNTLLSYRLVKSARSKTRMMPKSVALMRRMENLRKTNEPGSKQKIQRTRRKRTTQHLEKTQMINRLMHWKRVITRTTWKEIVLVFTQWKGLQQQARHWYPMHLQCLNRHLNHLLTKLRMSMREMSRQDIRAIHFLKHLLHPCSKRQPHQLWTPTRVIHPRNPVRRQWPH